MTSQRETVGSGLGVKRLLLVATGAAGLLVAGLLPWGGGWSLPGGVGPRIHYRLVGTWNGAGLPSGSFERPIGIVAAADGSLFVTDAKRRVAHLSFAGAALGEWGREGDSPGEFRNPVGVAAARDGSIFVSDYDRDRIIKFTPEGRFLFEFGTHGKGVGQLDAPAALAVDGEGSVYAADFYNSRVQRFGPDGRSLGVIGHAGRVGSGALHYPTGVTITPDGGLLVADAYNYQLQWFDRAGRPVRRAGHHLFWLWPRPASGSSGFNVPTCAVAGRDGRIHVADSGNHRITALSSEGGYLGEWKIPSPDPAIYSPEQLALSPDGQTVYATDFAANRVLVLRPEEDSVSRSRR